LSDEIGLLITFSGLDGSGKSTLIEFLSATLEQRRWPVAILHLNDDVGVYAFLRAVRDRVRRRSPPPLAPGTPDPRSQKLQRPSPGGLRGLGSRLRTMLLWNKPVRRLLYPVDLLVFACYRAYLEKARGRVLIMDRYFYDTLVDLSNGRPRLWVRLLERITPRPTVPVLLEITPEESFRRKAEFSLEYLRRRSEVYRRVFDRVPGAVRLKNDDLERTKVALLDAVREHSGGGSNPS
jgi:thymidylate kinase